MHNSHAQNNLHSPAVNPSPRLIDWLFNPFVYIAGAKSLLIGLTIIIISGLIAAVSYTHFDGVLDLHTGFPAPVWAFPVEGLVNWLSLALVLLIAGKLFSKSDFRAIDLLGTQAMARWPLLLSALAALSPPYRQFTAALNELAPRLVSGDTTAQIPFAQAALAVPSLLIILVALVWMVALMYRSYSISCNIKGAKGAATFIPALIAAEILSKIILVKFVLQ